MYLTQSTRECLSCINPKRLEALALSMRAEARLKWVERFSTKQTTMKWNEWWNSYIIKLDYDELLSASEVISILQNSLDREE